MKYQLKALHMSLALHAFILVLLVVMGNAFPRGDNMIVVDFTMEDAAGRAAFINKPAGTAHPPAHKQQKVQHEEAETAQQKDSAMTKAEPLPPAHREKRQMTVPDALSPSSAQDDRHAVSENDKNYETGQNAFSVDSHVAAFSKETAGKGTVTGTGENLEKSPGTGVHGYLKANFSYIKDIINQHITYPMFARRMGWEGEGKISFFITATGDVRDIQVIESTGREILDRNAREAVKHASPFPRPPVEAKIIVPVLYRLH